MEQAGLITKEERKAANEAAKEQCQASANGHTAGTVVSVAEAPTVAAVAGAPEQQGAAVATTSSSSTTFMVTLVLVGLALVATGAIAVVALAVRRHVTPVRPFNDTHAAHARGHTKTIRAGHQLRGISACQAVTGKGNGLVTVHVDPMHPTAAQPSSSTSFAAASSCDTSPPRTLFGTGGSSVSSPRHAWADGVTPK